MPQTPRTPCTTRLPSTGPQNLSSLSNSDLSIYTLKSRILNSDIKGFIYFTGDPVTHHTSFLNQDMRPHQDTRSKVWRIKTVKENLTLKQSNKTLRTRPYRQTGRTNKSMESKIRSEGTSAPCLLVELDRILFYLLDNRLFWLFKTSHLWDLY